MPGASQGNSPEGGGGGFNALTATAAEVAAWMDQLTGVRSSTGGYDPKLIVEIERLCEHSIATPPFLADALGIKESGIDQGTFPGLPHTIIDFLGAPLELGGTFYTPAKLKVPEGTPLLNHHGYILAYDPGTITIGATVKPYTFSEMQALMPGAAQKLGLPDKDNPIFWGSNDYGDETIRTTRPLTLSEGRWLLMPKHGLPDMEKKTDQAQRDLFQSSYHHNYTPIEAVQAASVYLGHYLATKERTPVGWWGRTDTRVLDTIGKDSGSCVLVGHFYGLGLRACRHVDGLTVSDWGRLALRNF